MKVLIRIPRSSARRSSLRANSLGPARLRVMQIAVAVGVVLCGCHRTPTPSHAHVGVPPVESIHLRVMQGDAERLARAALTTAGLQVSATNRCEGWIRSFLGSMWEDHYRFRQWHIVINFTADDATHSTLLTLRAVEQSTSYPAGVTHTPGAVLAPSGFSRTVVISDVTRGAPHDAWLQLQRVALALADRGAVLLTELSDR